MSFSSLGISPLIGKVLKGQGFNIPTPIQQEAIPLALRHHDILGIAQTGSGKTFSYVLPVLQHLSEGGNSNYREPKVLVLVPTRELAIQVQSVFQDFLSAMTVNTDNDSGFKSIAIHGGVSINPQMKAIGKADIVVATPGRLIDLTGKNAVKLSSINTFVLDEADKMLNLGFKEELDRIVSLLPEQRQNLLYSATLAEDLSRMQQALLNDPKVIKISEKPNSAGVCDEDPLINQLGYFVSEEKKGPLLRYLIRQGDLKQVLVFASSTRTVDTVAKKLRKNNIDAAEMHSKVSQQSRRETLRAFKAGEIRVLVATDLLARGIDIDVLPCVINYELPRSPKDYIHRIGRTGRAGAGGDAISLISPDEMHHFRVIQKKMRKRVKMLQSEDINLHGF